MVAQAEHVGFVLVGHLVAANALEHAGAVVQRMRQHMGRRLRPRHQLAVLPDVIDLGDVGPMEPSLSQTRKALVACATRARAIVLQHAKAKEQFHEGGKTRVVPSGPKRVRSRSMPLLRRNNWHPCHFYVGIIGIRATFQMEYCSETYYHGIRTDDWRWQKGACRGAIRHKRPHCLEELPSPTTGCSCREHDRWARRGSSGSSGRPTSPQWLT